MASRSRVRRLCYPGLAIAFWALLPGGRLLCPQPQASLPRLTFTKTLKGSFPECLAITIDSDGKGTYDSHKWDDSPNPRPMQLSAGTTAQIFSLAQSLNYFRSIELESRHKVANMGMKTLTFEAGNESTRVQYNYTENHTATELTGIFEKISNVEEEINRLEYDMKYDHLSLPEALRDIQDGFENHDYVEAALMIPTLQKISANSRFMHLAQSRAQQIIERIQENR